MHRSRAIPTATVLRLRDGRELAFGEYGDPEGVPVLAFHGTPGSRLELAPAGDVAHRAGIRLVVPDRPGYGHSAYVPHRRLLDWPGDVEAIADHLGLDRFAVLGVSGGGPHALACGFALARRVTSLTVVSSPAPVAELQTVDAVQRARPRWLASALRAQYLVWPFTALLVAAMRRVPLLALRAAERWVPEADRVVMAHPAYRAFFLDEARRTAPTSAKAAAQDVALFARDWGFPLGGIDVPVTIWHGSADRLVEPANGIALAGAMRDAMVHMCDGEGHLVFATRMRSIFDGLATAPRPPTLGPFDRAPLHV